MEQRDRRLYCFHQTMLYLGIRGTSNYDVLIKSGFGSFFSIHIQNEMSLPNIRLTVNLVLSFLLSFIPLTFKSLSDLEYQGVWETEYTWWHFKSNILLKCAFYNSADYLTKSSYKGQQTCLSYEVTGRNQADRLKKQQQQKKDKPHCWVSSFKWISQRSDVIEKQHQKES